MSSAKSDRSFVVIQLSGGNDYLNTVVPYNNEHYYDFRPSVNIPQEEVLALDDGDREAKLGSANGGDIAARAAADDDDVEAGRGH